MTPFYSTIPWLLLVQLIILQQVLQITAEVPAIIIFGDSSVDTGNNNQLSTVLKSNFKPYGRDFNDGKPTGRFSNGRVPGDFISEAFHIKPTVPAYLDPSYSIKDFATGVCFASAGTGYDNATSDVLEVMPLWKELEYYKEYQKKLRDYIGQEKGDETLREALYLMSLGTNDFLENYYGFNSKRSSQFTINQYEDFILGLAGDFVKDLYNLGARKLSIGGLPPMGCLPLERMRNGFVGITGCNQEYNNVATEFNTKLQGLVVNLNKELVGAQIVHSNTYDILLDIIHKPSKY
ncbi:GDSL esterase/lipase, partial [Thalictrum thalictroides]